MARYAGGKYALGISDRSGKDEYESKQPQLTPPKHITDPQALRISRPDRTEPVSLVLLAFNSFKSGSSGSAVITVTEPGHGRSTGDTVRFRDVEAFDGFTEAVLEVAAGRTITKIDDDRYSFTASSGTATTGNVTGGGGFASAGPVTLSA
jgi:hypothetical protein